MSQHLCDISVVCSVSPDCFIPAPHVDSTVLCLDFKENVPDPAEFFSFVTRAFNARRKKLTSIFEKDQKPTATDALVSLGFSDSARCEELSPAELYNLFLKISC